MLRLTRSRTSRRQGATWLDGTAADRVGRTYNKMKYVEYEDATFTTPKTIPAEWEHLSLLGPVLRAQVGLWADARLMWANMCGRRNFL